METPFLISTSLNSTHGDMTLKENGWLQGTERARWDKGTRGPMAPARVTRNTIQTCSYLAMQYKDTGLQHIACGLGSYQWSIIFIGSTLLPANRRLFCLFLTKNRFYQINYGTYS
ncbi:hypothetical protein GDO78_012097 [Eleutherodactylus coqui]|uniref:Uncharacterized protein n=1 Tax=Eleutherodactylus coqui TaxID=57060 RepID=A0A8J6F501_ELECQ|nr:hypothetical protein GDO78_012097 [Eleutherodactylus coqui]